MGVVKKVLEPREQAPEEVKLESPWNRHEQFIREYPHCHALPEPHESWRVVDFLTPDLFHLIGMAYKEALPDQSAWWEFADKLANNLVLIGPSGFLLFEHFIPKGSMEFHGGKWPWVRNVMDAEGSHRKLLEFIMRESGVVALYALQPSSAKAARAYASLMGFQPSGVIPLKVSYNGVPENCWIVVLMLEE
jgi:hypothetical protein